MISLQSGGIAYRLSYRDVEKLLAECGVNVDHVTIDGWVRRFTPEFTEAAQPCQHAHGGRWSVDETYLKAAGQWTYRGTAYAALLQPYQWAL